jgi:hypothetical protein
MHFTAETAAGFFMFRPEDLIERISPRPILILHSAVDRVTNHEEAFNMVRRSKPPVELHLLHGTNHFMFVNPDPRVAFVLNDWLNRFFPVKS